jgi:hypothetical protein
MQFVTISKPAPLEQIAVELYAVEAKRGGEATKQAAAALREANPHLKDLEAIPRGTIIAVPDKEGLTPRAASDHAAEPPPSLTAALTQVTSALSLTGENLMAAHRDDIDDAKATVSRAGSKDFAKLIDTDELKAALAATVKNAEARIKATEASRDALTTTLKQARADIDDLQRRFGAAGRPAKPDR